MRLDESVTVRQVSDVRLVMWGHVGRLQALLG
jgi:hypothetical protein